MIQTGRRVSVFALALLILAVADGRHHADAHRALLLGRDGLDRATAVYVVDADIAWAVFGNVPAGGGQWLRFDRPASGRFRVRAYVGTQQANLNLNPWLAVIGPGFERPAGLEGMLAPGEGAVLIAPPADRELALFEQAVPWAVLDGASAEFTLPEAPGPYYLLVFDPSGQSGTYILDTGYLLD